MSKKRKKKTIVGEVTSELTNINEQKLLEGLESSPKAKEIFTDISKKLKELKSLKRSNDSPILQRKKRKTSSSQQFVTNFFKSLYELLMGENYFDEIMKQHPANTVIDLTNDNAQETETTQYNELKDFVTKGKNKNKRYMFLCYLQIGIIIHQKEKKGINKYDTGLSYFTVGSVRSRKGHVIRAHNTWLLWRECWLVYLFPIDKFGLMMQRLKKLKEYYVNHRMDERGPCPKLRRLSKKLQKPNWFLVALGYMLKKEKILQIKKEKLEQEEEDEDEEVQEEDEEKNEEEEQEDEEEEQEDEEEDEKEVNKESIAKGLKGMTVYLSKQAEQMLERKLFGEPSPQKNSTITTPTKLVKKRKAVKKKKKNKRKNK